MTPDELRKRTTNIYFAKRFSELIKEWKKRTGKTQKQFSTQCYTTPNSITNYKNGTDFPSPIAISAMIDVFNEAGMNVTVEDFVPHTHEDSYRYDPNHVKRIQDHCQEFAKEIGLNEGFLNFLFDSTSFGDPDEGYPVWSPLDWVPTSMYQPYVKELEYLRDEWIVSNFVRRPLRTTQAVTDDQKFTVQIEDGSSIMLSEIDLRILKDLQDSIVDAVQYFYHKRRKIMLSQAVEAVKQANPKGKGALSYQVALGKEGLIKIDPYMQYVKFVDKDGKEV